MTTLDQELIDTMKEIISNGGFENISQELQDKLVILRGKSCNGRFLDIEKRHSPYIGDYLVGTTEGLDKTVEYSEEGLINSVNKKILDSWEKNKTCPCLIQNINYI